jgi:hypothetical protein
MCVNKRLRLLMCSKALMHSTTVAFDLRLCCGPVHIDAWVMTSGNRIVFCFRVSRWRRRRPRPIRPWWELIERRQINSSMLCLADLRLRRHIRDLAISKNHGSGVNSFWQKDSAGTNNLLWFRRGRREVNYRMLDPLLLHLK